jgi:hypothetical protein
MSDWEKLRFSETIPAPAREFTDPQAGLRREYVKDIKADLAERDRLAAAGVSVWRMAKAMRGNAASMDFGRYAALCCGAKNRKGEPCKRRDLYANGRCVNHGGLSTGPKTQAGKGRALANLTARSPKLDGTP